MQINFSPAVMENLKLYTPLRWKRGPSSVLAEPDAEGRLGNGGWSSYSDFMGSAER